MPIRIEVIDVGRSTDRAIRIIQSFSDDIVRELPLIAERTRLHMHRTIQSHKRRQGSENNLENNINVEVQIFIDRQVAQIGIGNIAQLNQTAPYWALLNFGGMVSPNARFVPGFFGAGNPPTSALKGTGVGTEKFTHAPGVGTFMRVSSPIAPVNYIEKAGVFAAGLLRIGLNSIIQRQR